MLTAFKTWAKNVSKLSKVGDVPSAFAMRFVCPAGT